MLSNESNSPSFHRLKYAKDSITFTSDYKRKKNLTKK